MNAHLSTEQLPAALRCMKCGERCGGACCRIRDGVYYPVTPIEAEGVVEYDLWGSPPVYGRLMRGSAVVLAKTKEQALQKFKAGRSGKDYQGETLLVVNVRLKLTGVAS
jgi:Fe-S-cluster containining protein